MSSFSDYLAFQAKCKDTPAALLARARDDAPTPRDYQLSAVQSTLAAANKSMVIILPCAAGKTLVGVYTYLQESLELAPNHGRTLVVAHGPSNALQWKQQFLLHTTLPEHTICIVQDQNDTLFCKQTTRVVIATLPMLTKQTPNSVVLKLRSYEWQRCILDECHEAPTERYGEIFKWNVKTWTALTATPLRADGNFCVISNTIGNELSPISWSTLESMGFICPLDIFKVGCPLDDQWQKFHTSRKASAFVHAMIELYNPIKLAVAYSLLKHWTEQVDASESHDASEPFAPRSTIVFSDNLELLHLFCYYAQIPVVDGSTPDKQREALFADMRTRRRFAIGMSRCGDTGVDIPPISRILQLDALQGSQRQEVQRAGRALRIDPCKTRSHMYDLFTNGTGHETHAWTRVKFLQDQGYVAQRFAPGTTLCDCTETSTHGETSSNGGNTIENTASSNPFTTHEMRRWMLHSILSFESRKSKEETDCLHDKALVDKYTAQLQELRNRERNHKARVASASGSIQNKIGKKNAFLSAACSRRNDAARDLRKQLAEAKQSLESKRVSIFGLVTSHMSL